MIKRSSFKMISEIHKSVPSVILTIYDIVKVHGGELKVETIEGEGSVFNIQIPIN